jgi:hypothetical protein
MPPKYTALSYVWGSYASPRDTITCNGVELEITIGCAEALRQLRTHVAGPLILWVDAICINQADTVEKSRQIRLMQEIYTWAATTYVWLGKGTPQSDKAMDYLAKASRLRSNFVFLPYFSGYGMGNWREMKLLRCAAKSVTVEFYRALTCECLFRASQP